MSLRLSLLALLALLASGSGVLAAGGVVHGRVTDPGGLALPGVVVTLKALSSGAAVTAVSDGQGEYTFDAAPGEYLLRAELSGFEPVERRVTVALEPVSLDLALKLANYSEQVTVKAEPPPAVLGEPHPDAPVTVTREVVDAGMLPNSQYDDVLPLLPNVVRGPDGQISVAGSRAPQSALFVNGFNETDPIVGEPRLMLPLEAVDTMDVFAGGFAAELGPATGGVTSVHTRSGGDTAHMTVTSFMPRVRFPDGKATVESWEPNVGLSGPLVKDRLFLAQGLSYRYDVNRFDTLAGEQDNTFKALMSWTQLDLQVSPGHHLAASLSFDPQTTEHANITAFTPKTTVPTVGQGGWTAGLTDRIVPAGRTVLEWRVNALRSGLTVDPDSEAPGPYALGHDIARGSYWDQQDLHSLRVEAGADLAWTGLPGHTVKIGGSMARATLGGTDTSAPVQLLYSDGSVARDIRFVGGTASLAASAVEAGLFVQDTWTPVPALTIDAGARYDGSSALRSPRFLPRLSWTLRLDDRTGVTGSVGMFADKVPLRAQVFSQMPSRVVRTYGPNGSLISDQAFTNALDAPLFMPVAARWDLEVDRRSSTGWLARVRYQERRGRDEAIVTPLLVADAGGELLLTSTGRSRSRSVEATVAYRAPHAGHQVYFSYVRSSAVGDLNSFDVIDGAFRPPLIQPNAVGPLSADVPHRLLAWGLIHLPARFELAPFAEVRNGFPFSAIADDWSRFGVPNGYRQPWFGSLDLYVNKVVGLPYHLPDARVGLKIYSLASVHSERDIQADIARADFGFRYNAIPRDYTAVFELLWGKK